MTGIAPRLYPALFFVLSGWLVATPASAAQQSPDSLLAEPLATRDALEALARRLLEQGDPTGIEVKVRARLANGDFRPGDRVLLDVQNEPTLSDTFAVGPDTALQLPEPTVGRLSLHGVLRVEFEDHVTTYVRRFVRDAVVRARSLVQLSVQGEVARAGYHGIPVDAVLTEVLMAAGGATRDADLDELHVDRNGQTLLDGEAFRLALTAGHTLADAGVRDGDTFVVPRRGGGEFMSGLRFLWILVSISGGVYGLTRAF